MSIEGAWHKASYSKGETNCVECAPMAVGGTAVRDTQNRELGYLAFPRNEWGAFLESLRADLL